jgi:hypothetical protein
MLHPESPNCERCPATRALLVGEDFVLMTAKKKNRNPTAQVADWMAETGRKVEEASVFA